VTSDIKEVLFLEVGLIRFVLFEECPDSVVEEDPAVVVHLLVETLVDTIVHKVEGKIVKRKVQLESDLEILFHLVAQGLCPSCLLLEILPLVC
jgi:hypothetical protein